MIVSVLARLSRHPMKQAFVILVSFFLLSDVSAQSMPTVNGRRLSAELLNQTLTANIAQGQADTPELRQVILEEMINREILAQEAQRKKLDQTKEATLRLEQLRQSLLIDLALTDYFEKNPISEAALKAEYQRQIELLGSTGPLQQYRLRLAVFETEAKAREAIRRVRDGASLEEIATKESTDKSRTNGGLLEWLLPNQLLPAVSNVIVNLSKGAVTAAPIQTPSGWNVVRVEEIRPFKVPSYEESVEQLRASLIQQRRLAYINELRKSAKITR